MSINGKTPPHVHELDILCQYHPKPCRVCNVISTKNPNIVAMVEIEASMLKFTQNLKHYPNSQIDLEKEQSCKSHISCFENIISYSDQNSCTVIKTETKGIEQSLEINSFYERTPGMAQRFPGSSQGH